MSKLTSKEYPYPLEDRFGTTMAPSNKPISVDCLGNIMNLGPDELRLYPIEYADTEIIRMSGTVLFLGQHYNVQCVKVDECGAHRCSPNEFCSYHVVDSLQRGMRFQTVEFQDVPGEWILYIVPEVEYDRPDAGPAVW